MAGALCRRTWALGLLIIGLGSLARGSWIFCKAAFAQVLLRHAWAEARAGEPRARPWPWADTWPVARLVSPDRGVDLIVLEGATGSSLAFGPGHVQGSALPGSFGNVALAGHRDTHFRFLEQLQLGEPLWLELPSGAVQRYEVQSESVVDQQDTRLLEAPGHWLTLVTCFPFNAPIPGGPLRFVLRARPAASRPSEQARAAQAEQQPERHEGGQSPEVQVAVAPAQLR